MKIIKILLDIDGVLCNFEKGFWGVVKKEFGIEPPLEEDIIEWKHSLCLESFDQEKETKTWEVIKSSPNFWEQLSSYSQNIEGLKKSIEILKHDKNILPVIYYVTTRPETITKTKHIDQTCYSQTKRWLKARGLVNDLAFGGLIFATEKENIVKALGLQYALDDKVGNLSRIDKTICQPYLLTRPWNFSYPNTLKRVQSVTEFFGEIIKKEGT